MSEMAISGYTCGYKRKEFCSSTAKNRRDLRQCKLLLGKALWANDILEGRMWSLPSLLHVIFWAPRQCNSPVSVQLKLHMRVAGACRACQWPCMMMRAPSSGALWSTPHCRQRCWSVSSASSTTPPTQTACPPCCRYSLTWLYPSHYNNEYLAGKSPRCIPSCNKHGMYHEDCGCGADG